MTRAETVCSCGVAAVHVVMSRSTAERVRVEAFSDGSVWYDVTARHGHPGHRVRVIGPGPLDATLAAMEWVGAAYVTEVRAMVLRARRGVHPMASPPARSSAASAAAWWAWATRPIAPTPIFGSGR